jgi:serine protease AprX
MTRIEAQHRTAFWRPLMLFPLILLVAVLGTGSISSEAESPRLQSAVLDWAEAHPGEAVPVIVQMKEPDQQVMEAIEGSGGIFTRDLRMIRGFSAVVPRDALEDLASYQQVSWISLDAPVVSTHSGGAVNAWNLKTAYPFAVEANDPWSRGYNGAGIGVAVVDTGISPVDHQDFTNDGTSRVVAQVAVNPNASATTDSYGHGTHVAGIIGGDGSLQNGKYIGIAPGVNLINVKVSDDNGVAAVSDVISGLQWVIEHKDQYNIRAVNLSLRSTVAESYTTDPLDAAVELAWFKGIFVAVASGNLGNTPDAVNYAPANDPFVMTVGAIDDNGTGYWWDDTQPTWSSRGTTQDGFSKPDMSAPGRRIVSLIDTNSYLYQSSPDNVVDQGYFRMSGTSMATGVMSGVAALVLERHPDWTPGELKCTLIATSRSVWSYYSLAKVPRAGSASNRTSPKCNSNDGLTPNTLLLQAAGVTDPQSITWGSITWGSITWGSVTWGSITWDSILTD